MAPKAVLAKGASDKINPNQTLYVTNLDDKLPKPDLRRNLYHLFTTYGPVLDIVALKTMKMRGQAFVVFRDTQNATQAMRSLNDFEFFGRKMKIAYAKEKSDTVSKLDGTFQIPISAAALAAGAETGERSELQESIFAAPPGAAAAKEMAAAGVEAEKGVKRTRDAESDSDEPMDEDDDEGAEMDMDESD